MKKILLGLLFVMACSKLHAASSFYFEKYGVPRSTVIAANDIGSVKISTGQILLAYYQVLSTGSAIGHTIDIYDSSVSTTVATKSYLGFPTSAFIEYDLGISISSGAMVVNRGVASSGSKIRLLWYQLYRN